MNPKKLLVLVVILGAVVGVFLFDKNRLEEKKTAEEHSKEVLAIPRDDVETITVERLGEKPVVIAKSAEEGGKSTWKITGPVATAADQSTVENLLVTLVGARKEKTAPVSATGERASDYGLEPVEIKVTLKTATKEEALAVGLLTPAEDQVYARRLGEPAIFLLPKTVQAAVNKSLFDLRDKALVGITNYTVNRLSIADATHRIELAKETEDLWKIESASSSMRAERNRINDFLNDLSGAKVAQFVDDATVDLSAYGLVSPSTTVEVWEGDKRLKVKFGSFQDAAKTRLYAQVEGRPGVLVLEQAALKNAPANVEALRSKKFFATKSWDAGAVKVESSSPALSLSFTKDASGEWQLGAGGSQRTMDYSGFAKFYDTLDRLSAAGFASSGSEAVKALQQPEWTLVISASRDNLTETIQLSALSALTQSRYARRAETGELLMVNDEDLDELRKECDAVSKPPAPPAVAAPTPGSASPQADAGAPPLGEAGRKD